MLIIELETSKCTINSGDECAFNTHILVSIRTSSTSAYRVPASLSELTPMIYKIGLTHLGSEASKCNTPTHHSLYKRFLVVENMF